VSKSGKDIVKWADQAMFEAAPMKRDDLGRIVPQVFLLNATPDPLGSIAAACRMYKGIPTYDLAEITDDERRQYWDDALKTHLQAPLETVDFHFLVEAVTRSWTHQVVRQRTAVYFQESLRFAVKENLVSEVALPPSVVEGDGAWAIWNETLIKIEESYNMLVNAGIPAEDARGLLPHATTTRIQYKTNLRGLLDHAGNRLCTQAQFEWRKVFLGIMRAIQNYKGSTYEIRVPNNNTLSELRELDLEEVAGSYITRVTSDDWQYELLGQFHPKTFAPVCYKLGKCPFKASFDRQCSIRERVEANAEIGRGSERWHLMGGWEDQLGEVHNISPIRPEEWMADPTAARRDG
jgi:flavin-dependent thymidylate synthase